MAPMGEFPLGPSHGHLPIIPVHRAIQKVKEGMDELMGFGWERLGKYALCPPESQGKKWLMGGATNAFQPARMEPGLRPKAPDNSATGVKPQSLQRTSPRLRT